MNALQCVRLQDQVFQHAQNLILLSNVSPSILHLPGRSYHAPWNIFVTIYERFLILKIFELDFVNFDSDNDKNPRKK